MAAKKVYFVVGTDTSVGKTVVTAMIARYLRDQGVNVMVVKPFCSGGRDDARWIREALGKTVDLDEINPWHFRAALTPLLAARKVGVRVELSGCLQFLEHARRGCDTLLIEGAGGLLSPLGEGFDARDLVVKLNATPLIVCPNQLGSINQIRLVLAALPNEFANRSRVVLIDPAKPGVVARTNAEILREIVGESRVIAFPQIHWPGALTAKHPPQRAVRAIQAMLN
jgi:dethiobiotin synthetase